MLKSVVVILKMGIDSSFVVIYHTFPSVSCNKLSNIFGDLFYLKLRGSSEYSCYERRNLISMSSKGRRLLKLLVEEGNLGGP